MKKVFICVFIVITLLATNLAYAYSDIIEKSLEEILGVLSGFDIIHGYEDETFKPQNKITRAEFCKIICKTGIYDAQKSDENKFEDVADTHWANVYIYTARSMDIINGISESKFAPEAYITYEQAIKMIVAALGYNEEAKQNGGYPNGYIKVAQDLGVLKNIKFKNDDFALREDIAKVIRNALEVPFYFLTKESGTVERKKSTMTLYEVHNITYSTIEENTVDDNEYEGEGDQQSVEQVTGDKESYDEADVQENTADGEVILSESELETVG